MKTLVIISDIHAGSLYGLTPPSYISTNLHHSKLQKEAWSAYMKMVGKWEKPDILLVNGDCIEGRQDRQGGAELLTNDRNVQADMAVECLQQWDAKKILMTFGTAYHTGSSAEDFEYNIADKLGATIEGRLFFEVEGMIIDARHKVASSIVPYGRATPLIRDMVWNSLKAAEGEEPRANLIIRSHTHYHLWVETPNKIMFTTPALQLARGRFGSRECVGETHWGAIRLKINKGQIVGKEVNVWKLIGQRQRVIRVK